MTAARPPIVRIRDLSIRFRRGAEAVCAVNGIGFDLAEGEVLTVIGESGSGKSVMLRALMSLLPAHAEVSGLIEIAGRDIASLNAKGLRDLRGPVVSLVYQEPSTALDPVFRIGDQIAEMIVRHEGVSYAAARNRARELFELVAIPSPVQRLDCYPHELSGGMRQRAMIALALSCRPRVLLADEPTTALDATVQIQLLLLLRRLQRELDMAVIFVTHDMGVAAEISDTVSVMYAGRFVETGPVESVLLAPLHPYTRGLLASTVQAGMRGQPLTAIAGAPPDLRALPKGCAFAPRCPQAEYACAGAVPPPQRFGASRMVACLRAEVPELAD